MGSARVHGMGENMDIIYGYSRKQAIEDGVLVDLTVLAPEVCAQHFKLPIAVTSAVYDIIKKAVENKRWHNDYNGVIHDMLYMSKVMARPLSASTRLFRVIITGAGRSKYHDFKMVCGPGDDAEPVLTIMLPEED